MSSEEQVGKYKILGELGKGSMGVVYRAEDPEIGRIVAIKTLRSVYLGADAAGQEALQRFRQEARSAGRLKHPNIVTIFETGRTDSGSPFIVMEFIEGESLESKLNSSIEPLEALHLLAQVGSAIDYAHSHGIVHRDIKPSNVIIDSQKRPHLLDFGVAKLSDTSLTPAGTVVGTPSYMAPEQIRGESLDGATDRFAFAVLSYEMLTGTRPFPGHDFMTVVSNIIHSEPIPFSQIPRSVPREFETVLRKGMSKVRDERYPSCLEFVRALAEPFGYMVDHSGVAGYREGETLKPKAATVESVSATISAPLTEEVKSVLSSGVQKGEAPQSNNPNSSQPRIEVPPADSTVREGAGRGLVIFLFLLILAAFGGAAYFILTNETTEMADDESETPPVPSEAPPSTIVSSVTSGSTEGSKEGACLVAEGCTPPSQERDVQLLARLSDGTLSEADLVGTIAQSGELPYEQVTPVLLGLLKHPNYKVRIAVLKTFTSGEKFRTRAVFRSIVEKLEDDEFLVRGFTAKFLGSLQNEAAVKLLEAHLPKEKNPAVRKVIEDILKKGN